MATLASLVINILTKANITGLEKTDRAVKKTTTSLKKMNKDVASLSRSGGLLSGISRKLMGGLSVAGIGYGFNQYLQFEKDLGAIHSRFFAITKDEQKAVEEFDYIRKIAKETANDIKATADSYSIFYSSTSKTLGKEGAREVFEDWTKVGRVLHLSEFQMERVTYALREMASKGAIYSQDLRMQIGTHVPNAMGLAQKASEEMGITGADWFEKLQKKAKGNMQVTTEFVRLFSKYAKQEFASPEALKKALQQPDSLAQMLKNLRTEFGIKVSESGGKDFVVGILRNIYNLIESLPLDAIAKILGTTLKIIGDHFGAVIFILQTILAYLIAQKWGSLFASFGKIGSKSKFAFRPMLKGGPFMSAIAGGILKAGAQAGLWKILQLIGSRLIGFLGGPIGIGISLLISFLPQILGLINKIWQKFSGEKNLPVGMLTSEVSTNEVLSYLRDIKNQGIIDPQTQVSKVYEKFGKDVGQHFNINDKSQVTINLYGVETPVEASKEIQNTLNQERNKKYQQYFNKPLSKKEEKFLEN